MTSDVCSHVKVVVRVRPFNDKEQSENSRKVVQVVDNHMLIFDPKEQGIPSFGAQRLRNRDLNKKASKDLKFVFDNVFGEDSTQLDIFENTTKGVLDGVLNGFNCTVFAYGATGAGKTHTMLGCGGDPGVMYRTMNELFRRMDEVKDEKVFEIAFSYLEVYNEQIRDLLANVGPLAVREDSSKGVVVHGLTLHQPKSAEHILEALDFGNRNRTQHPTEMNATSSRSHAVFQIYLRQQDKSASLNPNVRVAKLSLIDLAGSERASATNARGARQREGANINRSLLALGNVINALANPKNKNTHIPYRDSKLTRLLKDSLGGNCRTVMIANVSPSSKSYDDTHNTLKYANRAKEIKSSLKSNVVSLDSHISQYAVICERQRQEIILLKNKIKEYEERKMHPLAPGVSNPIPSQKLAEMKKMSDSLHSVFSSQAQIRREQLLLERQLKDNKLRQHFSEETNLHVQLFCAKDKTDKATCKHERRLASLLTQQQHLCQRLGDTEVRFLENDGWLHRLENEMKLLGEEAQAPEPLQRELHSHRLQLQVEDLKQHIEQMTHLIGLQDQENKHTRKLLTVLLPAYSRHYSTLKGAGLLTTSDDAENQQLEHLVLRERGVVWADQEKAEQQRGAESHAEGFRLAPILTFSHLAGHLNSPCSADSHRRRVSLRLLVSPSCKGEQTGQGQPEKKPTRRKLAVSPPTNPNSNVGSSQPHSPMVLQEVLKQEEMYPLQYTPEPIQNTPSSLLLLRPSDTNDPNMTFDITDCDDPANTTGRQTDSTSCLPTGSIHLQPSRLDDSIQPTKRLAIPSLFDLSRNNKPRYTAMTSAAQGKRKYCMKVAADHTAPKRIKQDPASLASRPLRVRRMPGSEENEPRRVVRSVSEGNLNFLEVRKPKSLFYKTSQQFKKVAKRL
ncbi:kinesin-like protein KIF18A isoform X2 [Hypomesus transpacificus]|uniref:kinesin-like protein KIF18A isoform X2 n=1 Tax=Hypomesus transpacificus TaxID=137520 RepID=UPI001F072FB0|nr:kinesin-like protein KIF18A isoform X2 [Hypomesus transpacificus]